MPPTETLTGQRTPPCCARPGGLLIEGNQRVWLGLPVPVRRLGVAPLAENVRRMSFHRINRDR